MRIAIHGFALRSVSHSNLYRTITCFNRQSLHVILYIDTLHALSPIPSQLARRLRHCLEQTVLVSEGICLIHTKLSKAQFISPHLSSSSCMDLYA
jgi:hypothetical protein